MEPTAAPRRVARGARAPRVPGAPAANDARDPDGARRAGAAGDTGDTGDVDEVGIADDAGIAALARRTAEAAGEPAAPRRRADRGVPIEGSALLRGVAILERVCESPRPLPLRDLAAALGLPKPTVLRLARQLEHGGWLVRDPHGRGLAVGPRAVHGAMGALRHAMRAVERRVVLRRLVMDTGQTVNLTAMDGDEVVYLDRVESDWPVQVRLVAGSRVPLHCTATGKTFLAHLPARQRRRLVETLPLRRCTAATIVEPARLLAELVTVRAEGVAIDAGEFLEGLYAVAVPVRDARGRVIAAVAVHGGAGRFSVDALRRFVPRLREAAAELEASWAADYGDAPRVAGAEGADGGMGG